MGARERLVEASLAQRSFMHRLVAWVLAVVAPTLIAVGWISFRSSFGLAGFLIWALLAVVVVALIGGVWPALLAIVAGFVAAELSYAPPYGSFRLDVHVNLVAFIAFAAVGAVVGILVDELARLAREQAALRRVATLAARAAPSGELFAALTEEVGGVFGADRAMLHRYGPNNTATVVGNWTRSGAPTLPMTSFSLEPQHLSAIVVAAGHPVHIDSVVDGNGLISSAPLHKGARRAIGAPIFVSGGLWGALFVLPRPGRHVPRDVDVRIGHFTDLVAMAAETAESRAELAASRARIVAAADETRRRIERDLHDGAQQRLVSLGLELRTAETIVPLELTEVRTRLGDAAAGVNDVLSDLQEISRGIHPAILSRGGLGPAIRALARRSVVPVELELRASRRLPESVEVAAYYVVSEALTNVAKHAQASVVQVEVREEADVVRISIRDDGIGGADPNHGTGLFGLRDRVEVLGGRIQISSADGAGTSLLVSLPSIV